MNKVNYSTTSKYVSHTLGNVASYVRSLVSRLFPKGYIRHTNVSTTIGYKYFDVFKNTPPRIMRAPKPYIIIQPRLDTSPEDYFLGNSYLTTRMTDVDGIDDIGNLLMLVEDDPRGYNIMYQMSRMRMYFDVSLVFETQMQQVNWYHSLRNQLQWNTPMMHHTTLEHHIPREIIAGVSHITGENMECPAELLRIINRHSVTPITYKMKTSTGCDEYFSYQNTPIDIEFTDLSLDDSGRIGMVDGAYNISFTISAEFMTTGRYHIFTRDKVPPIVFAQGASINVESENIDLHFTSIDELGVRIPDGWEIVAFPSYSIEPNNSGEPDVLDFSKVIPEVLIDALNYHKDNGMPLAPLVEFIVSKDDQLLVPDEHYIITPFNQKLYTYDLSKKSSYRLFVIVNTEYINNLAIHVYDKEDK